MKENIKLQENKKKNNLFSICSIGIRNTFNIRSKFLLLFFLFFSMIMVIFIEYASLKSDEYEAKQKYVTLSFNDMSDNRILIKKQDKTAFTEEEYKKIEENENVDYIVKNDWFSDKKINLFEGRLIESEFIVGFPLYDWNVTIEGFCVDIEKFTGKLDIGRFPENENEVIIKISQNNEYIKYKLNEVMNKPLKIGCDIKTNKIEEEETLKATIVGIQYIEDEKETEIYAHNNLLNNLSVKINKGNSNLAYLFNGHLNKMEHQILLMGTRNQAETSFGILPSKKVEKGFAIVNNELTNQLEGQNIINQPITIYVDNIYYKDEIDLKISNTYTEKDLKKTTGYEFYGNIIFINEEDYNKLFRRPCYQSSVYVKDISKIEKTIFDLENMGIKAKKVLDYKIINNDTKKEILIASIEKISVTTILVIMLFFVSYFVIKLILKSRNMYYTVLRMLGAEYKTLKKIIYIELLLNASIAYFVAVFLIYLVKFNILHFTYIAKLVPFLSIWEYVLVYLIIVFITKILSRKFTKKSFQKTLINAYNEEV